MKQLRIGDITIDAVIQWAGPWRWPQDFSRPDVRVQAPSADDGAGNFDSERGMMIITYQTFVVRTPRCTILLNTSPARTRATAAVRFSRQAALANELFALGVPFEKVDYPVPRSNELGIRPEQFGKN